MSDSLEYNTPLISVVVPVYGCASALPELHRRLSAALTSFTDSYQIILVNDHSPDDSWARVQALAAADARVQGLDLSRNFGQHAAITAGLDRASGQWVVVMDCDLQDRPEEVPRLYAHAQEQDLDVVFARRAERQDAASKQWAGRAFHRVLTGLGGPRHDPTTANFGIFHQRVVSALRRLREPTRAFPLQVRWLGFRQGSLNVRHDARPQGRSSYRFGQLLRLAFNVILSFSDKPLRLLVKLGAGIAAAAVLGAAYLVLQLLVGKVASPLLAGVLLSVWLLGGLLLTGVGLVGLYVARTFDGVQNRPLYVVREEVGAESTAS